MFIKMTKPNREMLPAGNYQEQRGGLWISLDEFNRLLGDLKYTDYPTGQRLFAAGINAHNTQVNPDTCPLYWQYA